MTEVRELAPRLENENLHFIAPRYTLRWGGAWEDGKWGEAVEQALNCYIDEVINFDRVDSCTPYSCGLLYPMSKSVKS